MRHRPVSCRSVPRMAICRMSCASIHCPSAPAFPVCVMVSWPAIPISSRPTCACADMQRRQARWPSWPPPRCCGPTRVTSRRTAGSYREKIDMAEAVLGNRFGFFRPPGGFFLWLDVGNGIEAARRLWAEAAVKVLPGAYLAEDRADGTNDALSPLHQGGSGGRSRLHAGRSDPSCGNTGRRGLSHGHTTGIVLSQPASGDSTGVDEPPADGGPRRRLPRGGRLVHPGSRHVRCCRCITELRDGRTRAQPCRRPGRHRGRSDPHVHRARRTPAGRRADRMGTFPSSSVTGCPVRSGALSRSSQRHSCRCRLLRQRRQASGSLPVRAALAEP